MAEVDTSIYQNAPKQPDLMGTLSGVLGVQGQMNQNKLFQQHKIISQKRQMIWRSAKRKL